MSFLEEMEAFKELKKEEVEKMRRKAEAEEALPSKIVTVKPGVGRGRKKVTWWYVETMKPNERRRRIRSQGTCNCLTRTRSW